MSDFGVLLLDSHSLAPPPSPQPSSVALSSHVKLVLALEHVTHYAIHKDNSRYPFLRDNIRQLYTCTYGG